MQKKPDRREIGKRIEERFRRFFKGAHAARDEYDFETSTSLYEVKSCNLFNTCYNGNHLRKYKNKKHKKCKTNQLGRFSINTANHIKLFLRTLQTNKIPKYLFIIRVNKQTIYKLVSWEKVNEMLSGEEYNNIPIRQIFQEA